MNPHTNRDDVHNPHHRLAIRGNVIQAQVLNNHCRGSADTKSKPPGQHDVNQYTHVFGNWPHAPEELGKRSTLSRFWHIIELLVLMPPIFFIGLGIAILSVKGKATKESGLGHHIEVAIKLGPTIYPLLFTAITSRTLRCIASFACQSGSKLGVIELLMASRSAWSTIESQMLLRRFTAIGAYLMLLWVLSPLGGQASLRALTRREQTLRNNTTLRYLYTGPFATYFRPDSVHYNEGILYEASLALPTELKTAPRDSWGNVRVPRLEAIDTTFSKGSPLAWIPVPNITQPQHFSSLLGVPVVGLPSAKPNSTAEFSLETSYMSMPNCSAWDVFSESNARRALYETLWRGRDPLRTQSNMNFSTHAGIHSGRPLNRTRNIDKTFFLDGETPGALAPDPAGALRDSRSRRLSFVSARRAASTGEIILSATKCTVIEMHVEVLVQCADGGCRATAVRRSLTDTRPEYVTPLDYMSRLGFIITSLPLASNSAGQRSSTTEYFLFNGSVPLSMPLSMGGFVNMAETPPRIFAERLQLVLNTWYQLTLAHENPVFYTSSPANLSTYGFDFGQLPANGSVSQSVINQSCQLMCSRSTQATLTHSVEVFAFSRPWLALLFCCSAVLLATGIAGTVIGLRTRVPDMLGYVASMTYNNRYLPLPDNGGVLDTMHRARLLHNLRVSISDVESGSDIGRIAFTSSPEVYGLKKGRKYV